QQATIHWPKHPRYGAFPQRTDYSSVGRAKAECSQQIRTAGSPWFVRIARRSYRLFYRLQDVDLRFAVAHRRVFIKQRCRVQSLNNSSTCLIHGSETMTASEQADTQIDLIWLSEQDMIDAGVTDTAACVETMEETLILLDKGDYRMAGARSEEHTSELQSRFDLVCRLL